jgi:hypothetical protein
MLVSVAIWVRTFFGVLAISALAALILFAALRAPPGLIRFLTQFLGVQACISTWYQVDYLFVNSAQVGGSKMISDTGIIAQELLLPYWFWGALIAVITLGLLLLSLNSSFEQAPKAAPGG